MLKVLVPGPVKGSTEEIEVLDHPGDRAGVIVKLRAPRGYLESGGARILRVPLHAAEALGQALLDSAKAQQGQEPARFGQMEPPPPQECLSCGEENWPGVEQCANCESWDLVPWPDDQEGQAQ